MNDLREHWRDFARRLRAAPAAGIFSDFDGTLAPIAERPEEARLSDAAREALEAVAARTRTSAGVVSGRSLADVEARVGVPGLWYVGNHGCEVRTPSGAVLRFFDDEDVRVMEALGDELARATSGIEGTLVERKGPAVALHYRLASERDVPKAQRRFLDVAQKHARRVEITRGRCALEARPRAGANKGSALRLIRHELPAGAFLVYFGDDVTDRDAFDALSGHGVSVEVGGHGEVADYTLPDPAAVIEVLGRIAREH